ncbi:hypothetical protein [Frigoriglobus tundricola]|uniref:Uncharacterized protein n=1 Tax=Frigoriglobus tundricola TaxID=2774151 RepID=A0A6M5YHY3_9BACT|nr:hypothetical protein [Frigoriglobus tundricola]QJW92920.1 hypothetical protein FTUN_0417 [Frigoriglobus tundricola]
MKALFAATALFVSAGPDTTQPPTAPAPREVPFSTENLTFTYSGPNDTRNPKVEMSVKDGKIEVQWTMQKKAFSAIASLATVQDGVLTVIGSVNEPAVVSCDPISKQTGAIIEIVLADGTMKVYSTRAPKRAP